MTLSGKLIVFVLCAFVGCMAGLLCARRICEKENYYKELSNFCSHFKSCVAFRNDVTLAGLIIVLITVVNMVSDLFTSLKTLFGLY